MLSFRDCHCDLEKRLQLRAAFLSPQPHVTLISEDPMLSYNLCVGRCPSRLQKEKLGQAQNLYLQSVLPEKYARAMVEETY